MWVLVVEDNADIRESFAFLIEARGHTVEAAADGREALRKIEALGPPCLILLDLILPEMNGRELRQRLLERAEWAEIPIVIVSSMGNLEREAAALGAVHYFQKPVDLDELFRIVDQHCVS